MAVGKIAPFPHTTTLLRSVSVRIGRLCLLLALVIALPAPQSVLVAAQVCTIAATVNAAPGQQMTCLPLSDVMVALLDFQPLRAYQRRASSHIDIELEKDSEYIR